MAALSLRLLGCFEARLPHESFITFPRKTRALLAYLGLRPGRAYARDHLAGLLWGDGGDNLALKSLRQTVYVLHKTLPPTKPPILLTTGGTIVLDPASVDIDVVEFERLFAEGTPDALERAAALYQGDLIEGLNVNEAPFEEWVTVERERLRMLALEAFNKLLAHQSTTGQTQHAVQTALKLLGIDPLQEGVHRTLMRLYAAHGRRGAALKQYQVCVATLQRELGTEPESETKALYQEILQLRSTEHARVVDPRRRRAPQRPQTLLESYIEPIKSGAPLIGREAELARVRTAVDAASRGRGQIVAIVGEAGIGKSTILMALAAEADGRGLRGLVGHAHESEQVLAFGPWVEALRSGQLTGDLDRFHDLTPVFREALAHLVPELSEGGQDPAASPPEHLRLFEALTGLVRNLAAREPVLVMLEDVHWADEMSGRLLAFLARRIRTSRVLIAVTIRDEEMASMPLLRQVIDELSREPHFVQLMLSPLSRADTIALAQSLTADGGQADGIANLGEHIWRVSEGNPFMVVETVRALHEGTAPQNAGALPLPERVRRVVADRLDHLSDRGRHLASVAAVIGRQFDFGLLQRAAGLDERVAAESVEELVRRRVLHGVGECFDFSHERIREVAYAELIQPRRKILHVMVGNALEHVYAGNLELHHATLAAHYRAGEVWDKALTHFREAGTRALRLSAYREASVCFEQALEALARLPETRENQKEGVDLRFALRNSLLPLAELDRIHACLVEAEQLASALDDRRRLGWLSVYMSHHLRTAGDRRQARECANAAQGMGETLEDAALRIDADLSLGSACLSLGDYRRATELFRRTVRSLDDDQGSPAAANTALPAVLARAFLAQSLGELGEFEDGIASGAEAIRMAEALDDPLGLAYACMRQGRVYGYKGELQQATGLLERSCGLSRDWQIMFTKPIAVSDLGLAYVLMGRVTEGLSLLHQAMDASEYKRGEGGKPRLLIRFAEACLLAGSVEEAHTHAMTAFARTSERGDRGYEARALRLLGAVAAHGDCLDVEASELRYGEAITLAAELGMRPLLARCHAGLGLLHSRYGTACSASQHLGLAANMFRELQMTYWLEQMDAELVATN